MKLSNKSDSHATLFCGFILSAVLKAKHEKQTMVQQVRVAETSKSKEKHQSQGDEKVQT